MPPLQGLTRFVGLLHPTAGSPWAKLCRRYAAPDDPQTGKLALMGRMETLGQYTYYS